MKHPDAKTEIRVPDEYKPILEDLRKLTKDGENPNHMTKRAREGLWRSMVKYGWIYPILVDRKGMLGDGEQRLETCLAHKEYYGPVLRLDVDDVDRRLLRQVTNKLRGVHDPDLDRAEYRRLIEGGRRKELISILQLNEKAIKDALEGKVKEETYRIPALEEVVTDIELGDVYQVGPHRILCGDSTEEEYFIKVLDGERARMVMTDPPYNVDMGTIKHPKFRQRPIIGDSQTPEEWEIFCDSFIKNIIKTCDGDIYVCHAPKQDGQILIQKLLENGIHWSTDIIWVKQAFTLGRSNYHSKYEPIFYGWIKNTSYNGTRREYNVWEIKRPMKSLLHPTMKPVDLCARAIGNSSLPGDIVLDPFAGSGSTLIACEQLDRKGHMIEIDHRYCQIIIDRYEAYTGEKAAKIEVKT